MRGVKDVVWSHTQANFRKNISNLSQSLEQPGVQSVIQNIYAPIIMFAKKHVCLLLSVYENTTFIYFLMSVTYLEAELALLASGNLK